MLISDNTDGRPPLTELTPGNVLLSDLPRFPGMTGWFKPGLLSKLLLRVIVSDLFGQYADRRLVHAALDTVSKDDLIKRADFTDAFKPDSDGSIWLDYVADLGDGFDATYAIAYLLAQNTLTVDGQVTTRGGGLIMGGDEVYPTAERDEYTTKLRKPYAFAFPDRKLESHPPVLLLPGNHDWYDGLTNFLAIFCREKSTPIGAWRTRQSRSYFAAKIANNWWVWCIDIALVRDMDQPQANYFVTMAQAMQPGANIILCSAEPGWYKAEAKGDSYRTLGYAAWLAQNAKKDLKIPLVLSGDTHHYARYSSDGAQYITSGGGGAFVHGTLDLQDEIRTDLYRSGDALLSLKTTADETHAPCDRRACYPSQEQSRTMLTGNWLFAVFNPGFAVFLGCLYAAFVFTLTSLPQWDVALFIYLALFAGFAGYTGYQEQFNVKVLLLSGIHALAHFAGIMLFAWFTPWLASLIFPFEEWHWIPWLLFVAAVTVPAGGLLAGTFYGLNLLVTCRFCGINHNDAFSAMKLESHRHFLRIRIQGDTLHVYPIGLDAVPARGEWRDNPARSSDKTASVFIPPEWMVPHLIEGPVVIRAREAPSTSEVKGPPELPSAG